MDTGPILYLALLRLLPGHELWAKVGDGMKG